MSAIDQAFIRAYEFDETEPTPRRHETAKPLPRVDAVATSKVVESIAVQAVEAAVAQPQLKPVAAVPRKHAAPTPVPAPVELLQPAMVSSPPVPSRTKGSLLAGERLLPARLG